MFAVVVAIALAVTGVLVYLVFRQGVDSRIDEELADRQGQIVLLARNAPDPEAILARAGEPLLQIYGRDGAPVATSTQLAGGRLMAAQDVRRAAAAPIMLTRTRLPGLTDGARVRAFPIPGGRVAAIAEPRDDRETTLHRLAVILGLSLPLALIVASVAGYRVARAALRPVEAMRAQAAAIGTGDLHDRLAVPGTRDELDRLAVTLNELLGRLQRAVEQERRIVADASHELRTPVSILLTRLDVALRQDLDHRELLHVVQEARGDARRLARLSEDVLMLARADQGGLPIRPAPVEVHDLLESAIARNSAEAGDRTIRIRQDIPGGAVVLADPDRTAQIMDNIITNAIRHGEGDIELEARVSSSHVRISVHDHGPGYPPEFLPHAFDRFSQAVGVRQGGGLGLAIVAALVTAQGGTVTASNGSGCGAVTAFTLPLA
ncbi:MAG: HAMP domain-containing sensor histidine kinase [Thermoleophilia bacterium]